MRRAPTESHQQTQQNGLDLSKILEALKEELHAQTEQGKKKTDLGRGSWVCVSYTVNQSAVQRHWVEALKREARGA